MVDNINRKAYSHILYCICAIAIMSFGIMLAARQMLGLVQYAIVLNAIYVISLLEAAEAISAGLLWAWVAKKHTDSLPTFYTACSGFRMLFSLLALGIIYAIVDASSMIYYIAVFFIIYFVLLIFHSVFFSRMTKILFNTSQG